jgi:hypothetical protein
VIILKIRFLLLFLIIFLLLFETSCHSNVKDYGINKDYLRFSRSIQTNLDYWEIVSIPEGYVACKSGSEEYKIGPFSFESNLDYYWEFYPIKPGKFTICSLKYELGDWLLIDDSYAEDYIVDENLEIHLVGNKRPIYEIEKYDRYLFMQFTNEFDLHIDWVLEDYPEITYSVSRNYDKRTVNVFVHGSNSDNESELREIIEDHLNNRFKNLDEVMHDIEINITF